MTREKEEFSLFLSVFHKANYNYNHLSIKKNCFIIDLIYVARMRAHVNIKKDGLL